MLSKVTTGTQCTVHYRSREGTVLVQKDFMWKPSLGKGLKKHKNWKIGLGKHPRVQAPPSHRHLRIWPDFFFFLSLALMTVEGLLYCFLLLICRKISTERSVLLPPAPLPSARSIFSEWEKLYMLTPPQTVLPEESAFWTMNSWYWRSSAGKSLQLYLWHSKLLFIPLSVHVNF